MLKETFGDNALGLTQTYEWFKCFKNGRMSVDDDERSGRPSTGSTTENVAEVLEAILEDRRRTIHDICDIVKLSYKTCQRILSDELNMRRTAAKCMPRLLSNDQKEFPKMNWKLKGRRVESTEEIQAESQDVMKMLTQNDLQQCFLSWKSRWDRCINAEGDYFKGDGGE
jgi:hypothetical protein